MISFQLEKLTIEEGKRNLSQLTFELQARAKSAEEQLADPRSAYDELQSQLMTMMAKNTELYKLLEPEEANISKEKHEFEQRKAELTKLNER